MRLAAQLSVVEPGGIILLAGHYAASAGQLIAIAGVTCLLVDAVPSSSTSEANIEVRGKLPLADRILRGAAVDEQHGGEDFLVEVARCVREHGRIVAPAHSPIPRETRLLARDEQEWVGEVEAFTPRIQLRRVPAG
jgi:hypothetical protein